MGTSLSGLKPGTPNNTFQSLLHNYNTTFATGSRVALGSGTDTGLVIWSDAVGVHNGTAQVKIESAADADRTVTLPNSSGTITLGNGAGVTDALAFGEALGRKVVTLDVTEVTTSDTLATVGAFAFTPAGGGLYSFECYLLVETAAAGTGFKLALQGPTVDLVSYHITTARASATGFEQRTEQNLVAFGVTHLSDVLPLADEPNLCRVSGLMMLPAGPASADVEVQFASEVDTETVKILAGSSMIFSKLN